MSPEDQSTAFWNYVDNNKYLSAHKGQYAERYGEVQPWIHRFDAKILQDIFTNFGTDRKYTLQLSLDILNVGNWLNDAWGTYTYNPLASYENVRPLRVANRNIATATGISTAPPTFSLNANDLEDFAAKTTLSKSTSTSSTWGALFGIRLIF
jgi:hypothetical protein